MNDLLRRLGNFLAGPRTKYNPLPGIRYFYGSWQDALNEAERQGKPVFVDFDTVGFYPRQEIIREAFSDTSLAVKFNAGFVNYRVDAQQGEGLAIAERYRVLSYPVPTSLFVLWDGSVLHRASGYKGITGLLAEADKALALANKPNLRSTLEQTYLAGERDLVFLATYLQERANADMPSHDALTTYLSLVPELDWNTDETVALIIGNLTTYDQCIVGVLLQKLRQLRDSDDNPAIVLRNKVSERIRQLIRSRFHQAIAEHDEQELTELIADNEQLLYAERGDSLSKQEVDEMTNGYRRRFYAETKNFNQYRPLAEAEAWRLMTISKEAVREKDKEAFRKYLERKNKLDETGDRPDYWKFAEAMSTLESQDTARQLNQLVRYYEEHMTDPDDLEQALVWSARALEYDRSPGFLHTHARLLMKLGRTAEADRMLHEMSSQQTPGTRVVHAVIKKLKDYER